MHTPKATTRLQLKTRRAIGEAFQALDYKVLGTIYCEEGGEAFWKDRRDPCLRMGTKIAGALRNRLNPTGRSLYVGAGVAELPVLIMETLELNRKVEAYNLRKEEVDVLNEACHSLSFRIQAGEAQSATGSFDHIWVASVLNDPERFPELSALSYGRANPFTFDPTAFTHEREKARAMIDRCLQKLIRPGLVTTSVEEIPWITNWCTQHRTPYLVDEHEYPTAIVGDPVCFIRAG